MKDSTYKIFTVIVGIFTIIGVSYAIGGFPKITEIYKLNEKDSSSHVDTTIQTTNSYPTPSPATISTQSVSSQLGQSEYQNSQDRTGVITVISSPSGGNVFFDGSYRGLTPLTISGIASGVYIVEVDHSGYYDWKTTVAISYGETKTINAILNPMPASSAGGLYISSNPGGADVWLDNNYMGQTPSYGSLKLNNIVAGNHALILKKDGYTQYSKMVLIISNEVLNIGTTLH